MDFLSPLFSVRALPVLKAPIRHAEKSINPKAHFAYDRPVFDEVVLDHAGGVWRSFLGMLMPLEDGQPVLADPRTKYVPLAGNGIIWVLRQFKAGVEPLRINEAALDAATLIPPDRLEDWGKWLSEWPAEMARAGIHMLRNGADAATATDPFTRVREGTYLKWLKENRHVE